MASMTLRKLQKHSPDKLGKPDTPNNVDMADEESKPKWMNEEKAQDDAMSDGEDNEQEEKKAVE